MAKLKKRLYVDMDGTLTEWRAAASYEDLFRKGYFETLEPHENVVKAVKAIVTAQNDIEVFVLSAVIEEAKYTVPEKNAWLDRYLPEIDKRHRLYVPTGVAKAASLGWAIGKDDILLDDYTVNLLSWRDDFGGKAVKLMNNVNGSNGTWDGERLEYDRLPEDIVKGLTDIIFERKCV